jgi:hypothetical protein
LIKEITVAARTAGGDIDANPRLRTAVAAAKTENMPKDNIERAIKKGTGELEGVSYEENSYEGYGPGGAAILVESLTDNKNRAVAEIRHIFNKYGGNMGENGCVAWMFDKKGYFNVDKSAVGEDTAHGDRPGGRCRGCSRRGRQLRGHYRTRRLRYVKEALEGCGDPLQRRRGDHAAPKHEPAGGERGRTHA